MPHSRRAGNRQPPVGRISSAPFGRISLGRLLLREDRPFFIAEAGVNHENSLDTALRMVEEAAKAGADAIKFQSYKAETLVSRYSPAYWDLMSEPTRSQYELFQKHDHFNDEDYKRLSLHARECGIHFMSTPFDYHFADLLGPLMPAFKIASADITNGPLLTYCARKKKPMILSTGASTVEEVREAIKIVRSAGNHRIALLHCVLSYPCKPENANLRMIRYLSDHFPEIPIGYSDHVPPDPSMHCLLSAWLLGARIIEKHFTLDKSLPGNDHYHALDPHDLRRFLQECKSISSLSGQYAKKVLPCEEAARKQARRSLIAARAIQKGEVMKRDMIEIKRPGTGIYPNEWRHLLGKKARRPIGEDEILDWTMFTKN